MSTDTNVLYCKLYEKIKNVSSTSYAESKKNNLNNSKYAIREKKIKVYSFLLFR